jgi:transketolase
VKNARDRGRKVRLVSMPSTTTFDRQDQAYRESVLPPSVRRRVAVEAGARESWWRYVGLEGRIVGIDHFGASAPAKDLFKQYGFTPEHVLRAIDDLFV